jgi:hypothetical protein
LKKATAIFFLTLFLFSTTEAHQLLKLPVVFQHFHEHKLVEKDISFYSFIVLHYFQGDIRDADYDRDMQLPFKTTHECVALSTPLTLPAHFSFVAPPEYFPIPNDFVLNNDPLAASANLEAIFQPPRLSE